MRDILIRARDILINQGWTQEQFCSQDAGIEELARGEVELEPTCCFCTAGAVYYGAQNYYADDAVIYLGQFIPEDYIVDYTDPVGRVFAWNDDEDRTKEEVLDLFDRAIKALPDA